MMNINIERLCFNSIHQTWSYIMTFMKDRFPILKMSKYSMAMSMHERSPSPTAGTELFISIKAAPVRRYTLDQQDAAYC